MRPEPRKNESAEQILKELVRIRSDVGSDMEPVVQRATGFLEGMGLQVHRYAFSHDAPCIVARYCANTAAGSEGGSLVLYCHLDTAGFDSEKWRVSPLSAQEVNGRIFGRGTIDCKGLAAVWISLLGKLSARNEILPFDLVFVAVSDEESDGDAGIAALLSKTEEFADSFLVLSEGGGFPLRSGRLTYYTVQTGEMEKWVFAGKPLSRPRKYRPGAMIEGFRHWVYTAETVGYFVRTRIGLRDPARMLESDPMEQEAAEGMNWYRAPLGSVPRSFSSPDTVASFIGSGIPGSSRIGLKAVRRALRSEDTNARVLPLVTRGHSDNRHFRMRGIPTLGFFPLIPGNSVSGCHGDNEYIAVESLHFAEEVLESTILGLKEAVGGQESSFTRRVWHGNGGVRRCLGN